MCGSPSLPGVERQLLADTRPLANPHFRRLWLANTGTVAAALAVPAFVRYRVTRPGLSGSR